MRQRPGTLICGVPSGDRGENPRARPAEQTAERSALDHGDERMTRGATHDDKKQRPKYSPELGERADRNMGLSLASTEKAPAGPERIAPPHWGNSPASSIRITSSQLFE